MLRFDYMLIYCYWVLIMHQSVTVMSKASSAHSSLSQRQQLHLSILHYPKSSNFISPFFIIPKASTSSAHSSLSQRQQLHQSILHYPKGSNFICPFFIIPKAATSSVHSSLSQRHQLHLSLVVWFLNVCILKCKLIQTLAYSHYNQTEDSHCRLHVASVVNHNTEEVSMLCALRTV